MVRGIATAKGKLMADKLELDDVLKWLRKSQRVEVKLKFETKGQGADMAVYEATKKPLFGIGETKTFTINAASVQINRDDGTRLRTPFEVAKASVAEAAAELGVDAKAVLGKDWKKRYPKQAAAEEQVEQAEEAEKKAELKRRELISGPFPSEKWPTEPVQQEKPVEKERRPEGE
jgi:hypothetical protein